MTGRPDPARSGSWLLLIYKVPSDPARLRATVWRRLKGLGAVYLQDGTAVLPDAAAGERALRTLSHEIDGFGGTSYLMRCGSLMGHDAVVSAYNHARDEEYIEIVDKGKDFEAEIDKETANEHFSYAELEENDEDLGKLRNWLAKVQKRDVLLASCAAEAVEELERCEAALEGFATKVYEAESAQH